SETKRLLSQVQDWRHRTCRPLRLGASGLGGRKSLARRASWPNTCSYMAHGIREMSLHRLQLRSERADTSPSRPQSGVIVREIRRRLDWPKRSDRSWTTLPTIVSATLFWSGTAMAA